MISFTEAASALQDFGPHDLGHPAVEGIPDEPVAPFFFLAHLRDQEALLQVVRRPVKSGSALPALHELAPALTALSE